MTRSRGDGGPRDAVERIAGRRRSRTEARRRGPAQRPGPGVSIFFFLESSAGQQRLSESVALLEAHGAEPATIRLYDAAWTVALAGLPSLIVLLENLGPQIQLWNCRAPGPSR